MNIANNKMPEHKVDWINTNPIILKIVLKCFLKIKYSLNIVNICLAVKPLPKLKNICTENDPINFENYFGVYDIPLIRANGSKNYYFGMTSRKLKNRKMSL